jgi:hypothetical protein
MKENRFLFRNKMVFEIEQENNQPTTVYDGSKLVTDGTGLVGGCDIAVNFDPDISIRKNDGKLRMDLVPPEVEVALAEVLTKGLEKYEEDQWRKGHLYSTPYASLKRHLNAWWSGESVDPESGLSHLKHSLMNLTMLLYYEQNYPELDNRPKRRVK